MSSRPANRGQGRRTPRGRVSSPTGVGASLAPIPMRSATPLPTRAAPDLPPAAPDRSPAAPDQPPAAPAQRGVSGARAARAAAVRRAAAQPGAKPRPIRPPRPQPPGRGQIVTNVDARLFATSGRESAGRPPGSSIRRQTVPQPAPYPVPYPVPATGVPTGVRPVPVAPNDAVHPLTDSAANAHLYGYESAVKGAFDAIVPTLQEIASHRCEPDFVAQAKRIAEQRLGFAPPDHLLDDAWVTGLDMRRLFAWSTFRTYRRISDAFFTDDPLAGRHDPAFDAFLQDCGFHALDVTPCADGRLAHTISYVLRLPYGQVRRKSHAGSLFDIENTVEKWVETELLRFREGRPNTADAPTRYLKVVVYHGSSLDPTHQGCAAHGSDDAAAARYGWERLQAFRQAVENGYCCGASVDLLLIGLDTDTDTIRVHVPDRNGNCALDHWLDVGKVYAITRDLPAATARGRIAELVRAHAPVGQGANQATSHAAGAAAGGPSPGPTPGPNPGMEALIARLIENNISQIDYVRRYHGGHYADIGHAERFIGAGVGFEDIQLRNLTYFAYLQTVEESAAHVDVGIRIFTGLNISHGLPVPVVVRYDYHGGVPGARDRAIGHCERIAGALKARFPQLCADGLLHCMRAVRDCDTNAPIEVVGCTLDPITGSGH